MTDPDTIAREARAARAILENPVYLRVREQMRNALVQGLINAPITDVDNLQIIKLWLNILDKERVLFEEFLSNAQFEEAKFEQTFEEMRNSH